MAEFFGIDFGTTNSLVTYIDAAGNARPALDETQRPHPSVIWFRGEEVLVGRTARNHLEQNVAVSGDFVRSPKQFLGRDDGVYAVPGRHVDRRELVAHVLRFLKESLRVRDPDAPALKQAVFTVPVNFDGRARKDLREAALRAGLGVVYFVHEPLAALYAHLRSDPNFARRLAELDRRYVLVFDWGGGTLDLTLCRVMGRTLCQVANAGSEQIGGDRFDEQLRNLVRRKHAEKHGLQDVTGLEQANARAVLINRCELAKIGLSRSDTQTVFLANYLAADGPEQQLRVEISRSELEAETRDLIAEGLGLVERLLEEARVDRTAVDLCLPTGGMVSMPAIRNGLGQLFPGRVASIPFGDRIISEGAAWIAFDGARPTLAKPIEIIEASQAPFPIIDAGLEMPVENADQSITLSPFYCADPRDGLATFIFQRPSKIGRVDAAAERRPYGVICLPVDPNARPLIERIELKGSINHNYVATFTAHATGRRETRSLEIHDLEFSLRFPGSAEAVPIDENSANESKGGKSSGNRRPLVRSNIAKSSRDSHLIPGDALPPLDNRQRNLENGRQYDEQDYYRPCAVYLCGATAFDISYFGCKSGKCPAQPSVAPRVAARRLDEAVQEELRAFETRTASALTK